MSSPAPADFRPVSPVTSKIKKDKAPSSISLTATPDILASTMPVRAHGSVIVGFALETDDVVTHARAKLESKDLDFIVVNDATEPGAGFGVDTNRVSIISPDGRVDRLPLMSKPDVADAILDRVEVLLSGR